MALHSSTLAWKLPWTEEPGSPWGRKKSGTTEQLHFHFSLSCIGEGNGNPLQCSCLESSRDGGAWWAAVYGVVQSRTRLSSSSVPLHPHLSASPFSPTSQEKSKHLFLSFLLQRILNRSKFSSPILVAAENCFVYRRIWA